MPRAPVKARKSNGCTRKPDPLQVLSWIFFPLFLLSYWLLSIPPLPLAAQVIFSIIYGIDTFALVFVVGITTLSDPSDKQVQHALHHVEKGGTLASLVALRAPDSRKCYICKVYRQPLSEHCRICNICVEQFDHHCKWLNNCIGSHNYRMFSASLSLTTLHVLVHAIVAIVALCMYTFRVDAEVYVFQIVLQSATCLLSAAFLVLLLKLWLFHIELIREDKTTYEVSMGIDRRRRSARKFASGAVHPEQSDENGSARASIWSAVCFPCCPRRSRASTKTVAEWSAGRPAGDVNVESEANNEDSLRPAEFT